MTYEVTMHSGSCDNCDETFEDRHSGFTAMPDSCDIIEAMGNSGWHIGGDAEGSVEGNHYCPACFTIDDEDRFILNADRTKVIPLI